MGNTHCTYAVFSLGDHLEVRGCLFLGLFNLSACRQIIFCYYFRMWYPIVRAINFTFHCHFWIPYFDLLLFTYFRFTYPVMSTSREIRNILFSDEERLIRLSELMNFLKVIMFVL